MRRQVNGAGSKLMFPLMVPVPWTKRHRALLRSGCSVAEDRGCTAHAESCSVASLCLVLFLSARSAATRPVEYNAEPPRAIPSYQRRALRA